MRRIHYMILVAVIAFSLCPGGFAQELKITMGLSPYQVAQCNAEGKGLILCSGTWSGSNGPLSVRILKEDVPLEDWRVAGAAENGQWLAIIDTLPAGGPYTVAVRIEDTITSVDGVLAGDLWILAGQSNMQGVGNMLDVEPANPQVNMLAMNGVWRPAQEPLHILAESPDAVHGTFNSEEERQTAIENAKNGPKGAGLGMAFASEMVRRTGRPVGLICTAHGGTSMEQWNPAGREAGGASLYGSMYAQVQRAGGMVRGALWYQGESDANPEAAAVFREKFEAFIAAMRRDFENPDLPFYYVQIGRFVNPGADPAFWNRIQEIQRVCEPSIPRTGLVTAIDLELDDAIHVGTPSLKRLGKRLANLAERDLYGGAVQSGPRPGEITFQDTPYGKQARVKFTAVNGRLTAVGRPTGFTLSSGPDGPPISCVYRVELPADAPDTAVLWLQSVPENPHLWYGRGFDPCVNITDEADMAVPVFGPIPMNPAQ